MPFITLPLLPYCIAATLPPLMLITLMLDTILAAVTEFFFMPLMLFRQASGSLLIFSRYFLPFIAFTTFCH